MPTRSRWIVVAGAVGTFLGTALLFAPVSSFISVNAEPARNSYCGSALVALLRDRNYGFGITPGCGYAATPWVAAGSIIASVAVFGCAIALFMFRDVARATVSAPDMAR
jgi:hypothetical protein